MEAKLKGVNVILAYFPLLSSHLEFGIGILYEKLRKDDLRENRFVDRHTLIKGVSFCSYSPWLLADFGEIRYGRPHYQ